MRLEETLSKSSARSGTRWVVVFLILIAAVLYLIGFDTLTDIVKYGILVGGIAVGVAYTALNVSLKK
jgi:hypothetical protein